MSIRSYGEEFPAIAGIRRIDIPAQAAQNRLVRRRLRAGKLLDRGALENSFAIRHATVEHHLGGTAQIVGRCEHSGVTGPSAHIARGLVMHYSADRLPTRWIELRRRDLRIPFGWGKKPRVLH